MSGADSGGGWSGDGGDDRADRPRASDEAHPFRITPDARYRPLDLAGRGGMGEVLVAHDRRLGRDVALKRIAAHREDEALSRRLAREAWITARLEHPSIVPIYDAGEGDDGRLFYTMRLIHGRSLGEALADAPDQAARIALLRHFLAACEAVAYAHSHGIIHRDLKPANVLVGDFGETQLVDWGLAGFASDATARVLAEEMKAPADFSLPTAKGTPAYMSPEQARGERASPRTDVWALGAILHEILVGERLVVAPAPDQVMARLRANEIDRTRMHQSGAPAELCAIVEKATAHDPSKRYRDAGDVAADLARYLDGRRVEAHEYTTFELFTRLVRQLRVPLIAAASALLTASFALVVSFHRINEERARAVGAEASAHAALDDSRQTSAWALARQSVAELSDGAIAEAELLAAHALAAGESPDARGVVAAARANPHPTLAETITLPDCDRVLPGTWNLALCQDEDALALWDLDPPRLRWSRPLAARAALLVSAPERRPYVVVTSSPSEVLVLDADSGAVEQRHSVEITTGFLERVVDCGDGEHIAATEGRILTVISLRLGRVVRTERPCDPEPLAALSAVGGRIATVCGDGRVVFWDASSGLTATPPIAPVRILRPTSAALARDAHTLVVGGVTGDLIQVDLRDGRTVGPQRILDGPIIRMDVLGPDPRVLVFAGEHGGAHVWDLEAGAELLRLPVATSASFRVDPRGLLTGGRRAGRWELGDATPARTITFPVGLSAISISADGRLLAAARGDGRVSIVERASGRTLEELAFGTNVVKYLDFSMDGRRLAVSIAQPGASLFVFSVDDWSPLTLEAAANSARRLMYDARGELIALHYAPPMGIWSAAGIHRKVPSPEMYDLASDAERREQFVLAVDGGLWRLRDGELTAVDRDPGAKMIAVWPRGERIATGHDSGVSIRSPGRPSRWIANAGAPLTDLAVSPDGRYLLGGRSDGTVAVWRSSDYVHVATLRGHRQRVSHLLFAPDGLLSTAGWDGQILTWDLSVLHTPAAGLVRRAEQAWAAQLPLALRPDAR